MASKKPFVIGCLVVGCLLFIGTIFLVVIIGISGSRTSFEDHAKWANDQRKKQTSEAVGTITDYKESTLGKMYYYYVTYDFEAGGKKFTKTIEVKDGNPVKYPKGGQGKVCYEPANPENSLFSRKEDNYTCGQ